MSLQIEALSPIMWTIIIAVALVLIAAVVFTWKSSAMSTRKMVTIAMLTAVYVVLNFAGTVRLGWINISVASLPVSVLISESRKKVWISTSMVRAATTNY